jgi:RNA polymerase sigma-70 factor (ECF subfamily)
MAEMFRRARRILTEIRQTAVPHGRCGHRTNGGVGWSGSHKANPQSLLTSSKMPPQHPEAVCQSCVLGYLNTIMFTPEVRPPRCQEPMTTDGRSEIETLIAQVALGNKAAFSRLYDVTSGKLLAVCLRVLHERAAAEDAMQEVYIKVWNSADRYQVTGHSPMTWLITIARNTAIDKLRARRSDSDIADFAERIAAAGPSPEQSAVAASEAKQIVHCLGELDAARRAAVTGAYLDGKSYKDLSEQFHVPLNTMRTWLRRGLATLRECMSR